jgi:hypothetical protein
MSTPVRQDYFTMDRYAMAAIVDGQTPAMFDGQTSSMVGGQTSAMDGYAMAAMVDRQTSAMFDGQTLWSEVPSNPVDLESMGKAMKSFLTQSASDHPIGPMDTHHTTWLTTQYDPVISSGEP